MAVEALETLLEDGRGGDVGQGDGVPGQPRAPGQTPRHDQAGECHDDRQPERCRQRPAG